MHVNGWITPVLSLDGLWRQRFASRGGEAIGPHLRSLEPGKIGVGGKEGICVRALTLCEIAFLNQPCKWFLKLIMSTKPSLQNQLLPFLYPPLHSPSPLSRNHVLFLLFLFLLCSAAPAGAGKGRRWCREPARGWGISVLPELWGWECSLSHWTNPEGSKKWVSHTS